MRTVKLTVLAGLLLVTPLTAQETSPIEQRSLELAELFAPGPRDYASIFSASFLAQVPEATLDGIFDSYHSEHGSATAEVIGPFVSGVTIVRFRFVDGAAAIMQVQLDGEEDASLVAGALIGPAFSLSDAAAGIAEISYPTDDYETKTRLRLPFDGEWYVFWGGQRLAGNYHRAHRGQRYAYDFLIMRDGSTHQGEGTSNDQYWCEGQPVLAPGSGTIVKAKDGVAENVPGELNPAQLLGNHVVIDHDNGEFSLIAHLKTGSVLVEIGDMVESGDQVGECGNSGNSSEAHIHYQLQTTPAFVGTTSIPARFSGYLADGEPVESGEPSRGQQVEHSD